MKTVKSVIITLNIFTKISYSQVYYNKNHNIKYVGATVLTVNGYRGLSLFSLFLVFLHKVKFSHIYIFKIISATCSRSDIS